MANQDVASMSKLTKAAVPGLEASVETVLSMYWMYHLPQHYRSLYASIAKASVDAIIAQAKGSKAEDFGFRLKGNFYESFDLAMDEAVNVANIDEIVRMVQVLER